MENFDFGAVGAARQMGVTVGCIVGCTVAAAGPQDYDTIRSLLEKAHEAVLDAWHVSNDGKTPGGICVREAGS